ncbi:hypothetical protein HDV06_005476 [Boothiomyces sp. JEL0866]|nr:hypothetical protein HDV06_005476 [Boothiomyces sp. JEL0866]
MLVNIIINAVLGDIVLETLWDIEECSGQPTLMTIFTESNYSQVLNSWSYGGYSYPYCSCDLVPSPTGCCLSSIDLTLTSGFQSASYTIDTQIAQSYYWRDANEKYYCYYKSTVGYLDWGYSQRYIKPNGQCYDGMMCLPNELRSYNTSDCSGNYQSYALANQLQLVNSEYLNSTIAVAFSIFNGGKISTIWTAYFPAAILVPKFHFPLEVIGMICYVAAITLAVGVAYVEGRHFWNGKPGAKYIFLAQFIWIIWVVMNLCDWVILYPNVVSYEIMQSVENFLYNVGSMTSVLATFGVLLSYFKIAELRKRAIGYLLLWLIHITFAGSCYVTSVSYISDYYANLYTFWYDIYPLWNLLQFTLNTIPPVYIYLTIIKIFATEKNIQYRESFKKIVKKAPLIATFLPLQILNSLVYMCLSIIIQYTQVLANDRNFLAWTGLLCLANINHEVFNLLLMSNISTLVSKVNLKDKAGNMITTESSNKSSAMLTVQNTPKKESTMVSLDKDKPQKRIGAL